MGRHTVPPTLAQCVRMPAAAPMEQPRVACTWIMGEPESPSETSPSPVKLLPLLPVAWLTRGTDARRPVWMPWPVVLTAPAPPFHAAQLGPPSHAMLGSTQERQPALMVMSAQSLPMPPLL